MAPPNPSFPERSSRGRIDRDPGAERGVPDVADGVQTGRAASCSSTESDTNQGKRPLEDFGVSPALPAPFAWQRGHRVLLLDEGDQGWVFAELRFDEPGCRYHEVRRATFRWPREAAGAVLARGVGFGVAPAGDLATALDRWFGDHHAISGSES